MTDKARELEKMISECFGFHVRDFGDDITGLKALANRILEYCNEIRQEREIN